MNDIGVYCFLLDPPSGFAYTTPVDLLTMIKDRLYVNVLDAVRVGPAIQTGPPSDTTKLWLKVDSAGRAYFFYLYYSSAWRPLFFANPGEVKYSGVLTFPLDAAVFDSTGLGIKGGAYDSWAVCNGQNATPDLRNRFIIVGTDKIDPLNDPITGKPVVNKLPSIHPGDSGGADSATVTVDNLPSIPVRYFRAHLEEDNSWVGGSHTFGPPREPYFDSTQATAVASSISVTAAALTNIFTASRIHGFAADQKVKFTARTGGAGITIGTLYYVIADSLTTTQFKVSATLGGTEVNVTTDMTVGFVRTDPASATGGSPLDVTAVSDMGVTPNLFSTTFGGSPALHGYVVGDDVVFSNTVGGDGIIAGAVYYVIASGLTTTDFRVSSTPGGSTIDIRTDLTSGSVQRSPNLDMLPPFRAILPLMFLGYQA